ncbi:malto-oligosyltrehalose trehalohydrolase [Granulicella sp. 5B5]|uniref:malto-oligosyltrehalose trehalohydrolase n=1 Tax=Granulicella sp. 5B5 TaxID=1617967 RepID=UPI0015F4B18C|nr:malto-oligosyltrehalose trehalohydrolase [Granulicella sp. 5B5]QMV17872.1 malto-oligosyltrehalose trehalohydrolase [Granulicella sp. 5B5]
MHTFEVWAPRANSVAVQLGPRIHPMSPRDDRGWWSASIDAAQPGDDYGFRIDKDPAPYPDPRSLWQPHGVHGLSRILDHNAYAWSDKNWQPPSWPTAIIYELHIGTFTAEGTYNAAIARLPYLRELGITHVELMPLNAFSGRWGWGYDGVALFAPHAPYGTPDDLKHFVDSCHAEGLAVLLDVVYNHFGPDGNYTGLFGNYITDSHHTPWGGAINFEGAGSTEVRRFFCDNALMWLRDYHFDGLRLDAVHSYVDRSATHFLEQLADEVDALATQQHRSYTLIAESDLNDPRIVTPRSQHGYGIDAQWSDDFHHALFALLTGERQSYYADFGSLAQVAKSLTSAFVYDGQYSHFRQQNHGRPVGDLGGDHFLGYIQNHDQVGNRAHGDRIHTVAGVQKAKLAAAAVLTSPFIPMLFQGEEFAASSPFLYFADHEDPQLRKAVTEGRKREHAHDRDWSTVPDPEAPETYQNSKLNWSELQQPEHAQMLHWYRQLIQVRQTQPSLQSGSLAAVHTRYDEHAKWLIIDREEIQMLFNFSDSPVTLDITAVKPLLLSDPKVDITDGAITLPPQSFAALQQRYA